MVVWNLLWPRPPPFLMALGRHIIRPAKRSLRKRERGRERRCGVWCTWRMMMENRSLHTLIPNDGSDAVGPDKVFLSLPLSFPFFSHPPPP